MKMVTYMILIGITILSEPIFTPGIEVVYIYYLAPGGGCEVLFSPGLSLCLSVCVFVCVCVCVSGQYFGILFLGY